MSDEEMNPRNGKDYLKLFLVSLLVAILSTSPREHSIFFAPVALGLALGLFLIPALTYRSGRPNAAWIVLIVFGAAQLFNRFFPPDSFLR